jgi:hypothetical protein
VLAELLNVLQLLFLGEGHALSSIRCVARGLSTPRRKTRTAEAGSMGRVADP